MNSCLGPRGYILVIVPQAVGGRERGTFTLSAPVPTLARNCRPYDQSSIGLRLRPFLPRFLAAYF